MMQQAYVNAFTHLRQFNGVGPVLDVADADCHQRSAGSRSPPGPPRSLRRRLARCWSRSCRLDPSDNPERQAFTGELRGLLEWAIDELPNGMREVFVLREVEGLSTAEVAECLDVSEDVVKTRLSRGRAMLRRLLLKRTGATAPDAFRFYRPRCDRVVANVLARIQRETRQPPDRSALRRFRHLFTGPRALTLFAL